MKKSHVSQKKILQRLHHYFIVENIILHWSVLKRCVFILYFAIFTNVIWILWKIYLIATPTSWQYVHIHQVWAQLIFELLMLSICLLLIFVCQRFHQNKYIRSYMPLCCILFFTTTFGFEGYSIGIYSPATATGLVGIVGIGLLIFSKPLVYTAVVFGITGLGLGTYMSLNGILPYAPLFNLEHIGILHTNSFWVGTMSFFMAPLMISFIILFELILAQWRHRESVIQRNSQIDPLTNLYNRRKINEHLQILSLRTPIESDAVILLDLDHFKMINDTEGHDMGDRVLVEVSNALQQSVRNTDMVGRFGGEEFIILIADANQSMMQQIAERCRQSIENIQLYNESGQRVPISASFGIRPIHPPEPTQIILKHADDALYAAKAAGRNCIKFYDQLNHSAQANTLPASL